MITFKKSDYENLEISVGCHRDEDGNPLVVVGGRAIGPVKALMEFISKYETARPIGQLGSREFDDAVIAVVRRAERRRLL